MAKKGNKKETSLLFKIVAFVLVVCAIVAIVALQLKRGELISERDRMQADKDALEDEKEQLIKKVNAEMDDDYVIEAAKEKLNLRMPEEIIFYNDVSNEHGN